jgi:ATP-dependent Clp protease protease subunit
MRKEMIGAAASWYRVQAKKGKVAEVFIYDEIGRNWFGEGIAAEQFIKDLKALELQPGDELNVRINSPGGNVFEGVAIHNYLRTLKSQVTVIVDGIAASIASVVAMAGDRIEMPQNAMMFIHNPWMFAVGDAQAMRKAADDLDQIRESMASSYLRRIDKKVDRAALYAMLDAETWLNADEAVAKGFADEVSEPVRAAALGQFDLAKYGFKVPQQITDALKAHKADIEKRRATMRGGIKT